jgi:hypothetical protein
VIGGIVVVWFNSSIIQKMEAWIQHILPSVDHLAQLIWIQIIPYRELDGSSMYEN